MDFQVGQTAYVLSASVGGPDRSWKIKKVEVKKIGRLYIFADFDKYRISENYSFSDCFGYKHYIFASRGAADAFLKRAEKESYIKELNLYQVLPLLKGTEIDAIYSIFRRYENE